MKNVKLAVIFGTAAAAFSLSAASLRIGYDLGADVVSGASGNEIAPMAGCTESSNNLLLGSGLRQVDDALMGKVMEFHGARADYAYVNSLIAFSGARTESIWVFLDVSDSFVPDSKDPTKNANTLPYLLSNVSGLNVNWTSGSSTLRVCPTSATAYNTVGFQRNAWNHFVISIDQTDTETTNCHIRVFLNGVSVFDKNQVCTPVSFAAGRIILGNDNVGGTRPIRGRVKEFRVYDGELTDAEVTALYEEGCAQLRGGVVGYFPMEATSYSSSALNYIGQPYTNSTMRLQYNTGDTEHKSGGHTGKCLYFPNKKFAGGNFLTPEHPFSSWAIGAWVNLPRDMYYQQQQVVEGYAATAKNTCPSFFSLELGGTKGKYGRVVFDAHTTLTDNAIHCFDIGTMSNPSDQGVDPHPARGVDSKGSWNHLAFVYDFQKDPADEKKWGINYRFFVNGTLSKEWFESTTNECATGKFPAANWCSLGNSSIYGSNRSMIGSIDDFTFIRGALTNDQVLEWYRGAPDFSAGSDITVATATATLAGAIADRAEGVAAPAAKVNYIKWTYRSAPVGGETTTIANDTSLNPTVTLPVAGEYVYRLTIRTAYGFEMYKDVKVTRAATVAENQAPTVSVAAGSAATTKIPFALTATAADPDEQPGTLVVAWKKVSGPGPVTFSSAVGTSVKVTAYTAGTYEFAAVASDGQDATESAAVSVVFTDAGSFDLSSGLLRHWDFSNLLKEKVAGGAYTVDHLAQDFVDGVDGLGIRAFTESGDFYAYFNPDSTLLEEVDPDRPAESLEPAEAYRSFSCWIYHDTADTNNSYQAAIIALPYTLGLWYRCQDDDRGFTLYQQSNEYKPSGTEEHSGWGGYAHFPRPTVDPANRWTHVYAQFVRNPTKVTAGEQSELWIDGVKQKMTSGQCSGGRVLAEKKFTIGGHVNNGEGQNGHYKIDEVLRSRVFPGKIDEVRMYNRALTQAEIQYLAANPAVTVSQPIAAQGSDVDKVRGKEVAIDMNLYSGFSLEGKTLAYQWRVVEGDSSAIVFEDATAKSTTATGLKAGTYKLQLEIANEQGAPSYSEPITFTVYKLGMIIELK